MNESFDKYRARIEAKERKTPIVKYSGAKKKKKVNHSDTKVLTSKTNYNFSETFKYTPGMKKGFYQTREWRELRHKAISASIDQKCVICGAGRNDKTIDGRRVIIHVDHIKPRSKFPSLELSLDNLQILCEDCNLGKGSSI